MKLTYNNAEPESPENRPEKASFFNGFFNFFKTDSEIEALQKKLNETLKRADQSLDLTAKQIKESENLIQKSKDAIQNNSEITEGCKPSK